ncbi:MULTISPECIES: GNAT family N-acetyltransferase [unclassified Virgibacillus]|uniref:GNAT family N-acetyltransferase n=1 Tax=unclassified Virgibacillus TaxID=2620237 RepID=UPI0024DE8E03|nr:GNAT family N-acetyltransferase [Virgibacillus sp. LDC-1]
MIRKIHVEDAEALTKLIQEVEKESRFMLYGANERVTSVANQRKLIVSLVQEENGMIFVAEKDTKLVGYVMAIGNKVPRTKHRMYVVAGILSSHRGQGIGTALFEKLDAWAKEVCIHRLELTVVTENKAAVALYQKMGYTIEGTKRDSLSIDGTFFDEFYMAKLL